MRFEVIGNLRNEETIAAGHGIRDLARLRKAYGDGRWRKRKGTAAVRLASGEIRSAEVHWYEASGIGKRGAQNQAIRGLTMAINETAGPNEFVVCLRNDDYPASLEPRKLYRALTDPDAARSGMIRVVDESGEDYLYPEEYFLPVELSHAVEQALLRAS